MKKSTFTTRLVDPKTVKIVDGFASSGAVRPCRLADEVFKCNMPGEWLTCYMLRRFGFPNISGDDAKEIGCWLLATPLEGLYLHVSPSFSGESNLHFGVQFTEEVRVEVYRDPGREDFRPRLTKALLDWWYSVGCKRYIVGVGKAEGDPDELVYEVNKRDGEVYGLWLRKPHHARRYAPPKGDQFFLGWLALFVREKHPEVTLPKMNKREREARRTRFHLKIDRAIKATLRDLLRPVPIRSQSFSPLGRLSCDAVYQMSKGHEQAPIFEGAGYAAKAWYLDLHEVNPEQIQRY